MRRALIGLLGMLIAGKIAFAADVSPTGFFQDLEDDALKGWDAAAWKQTAPANLAKARFCPSDYPIIFETSEFVEIEGEELAQYVANVDVILMPLQRSIAASAASGDRKNLKEFMLSLATSNAYTKMKPYRPKTWEGVAYKWLKTYPKFGETAYYQAVLLTAASQAVSLIEADLSEAERRTIRKWGRKVADSAFSEMPPPKEGHDRMAMITGGLVTWGAAAKDSIVFKRGVKGFQTLVGAIREDGSETFFVGDGHAAGVELFYQNMVYGSLVLAAHIMERNGYPAFNYRAKGGALDDGVAYLLDQSLHPEKRKRIQKEQRTSFLTPLRDVSNTSISWAEIAVGHAKLSAGARALLEQVLKPGDMGYSSGHFGGFTSCLFRRD